ncbi:PQQ-binding-like beta-propeller repeat protein [Streptomyces sp. NPDC059037]|uniref:outer membrane protein assembly factor BamB family protein n=1 Tax=Streptomyces sp. NPDC059037 TaxID=3346710 RepID=UPI0036B59689
MTQPFPPPEQSPQGSFGPPPPNQASGFGPPPGGFGPPPPHQPSVPVVPTVPTAPMGPPGGGRRAGRRTAIVVAVVTAITLIVGGGVWYAASSGGGSKDKTSAKPGGDREKARYIKPKEKVPADAKAFFSTKALQPELPKGESTWNSKGSWLTDKVYAKASVSKIVGVEATSGKRLWDLPKPGESCAGSPDTGKDGIAAVVTGATAKDDRGARGPCTEVTAFDVDTGEELWTESITTGYQKEKTPFNQVTISGDTVAVGGLYGGAAFDLRTGKVLWEPKQGEKCRDVGYGGGEQLVAVRSCGDFGAERYRIQVLDPATGKAKWTHKLPAGVQTPSVVSSNPVVVALDSGEIGPSGATSVFSLDERGKLRARISLPAEKYLHACGKTSVVQDCRGIVAGNDRLYVPTKQRDGAKKFSSTNEIVVFSLATGKTTGQMLPAGDASPVFPIRMDGGNVLVYKSAPFAKVVSVDGRTLKGEKVLLDARTRPSTLLPMRDELVFTHNKMYISSDLLARPSSKAQETIMMYGFAAK